MKTTKEYMTVSSKAGLLRAIQQLGPGPCALDFETTSLTDGGGHVRLVSLCNGRGQFLVDFYKINGGFNAVAKLFDQKDMEFAVFNNGFEGRWFQMAGCRPRLVDVGHMRRAVMGGGRFGLKVMVKWDLDIDMDKEEQRSDWSNPELTQSQLDYAYLDAALTWQLYRHWSAKMHSHHWLGAYLLNDMWPAVAEMEDAGILLDTAHHKLLIKDWIKVQRRQMKLIRKHLSEGEVANINSAKQLSDFFARILPDHFLEGWERTDKDGQLSMKSVNLKLMAGLAGEGPLSDLIEALAGYKTITKYLSSFGETLLTAAARNPDGRIRPRYNVAAARTGRFSSSNPNSQQVPRDKQLLGKPTSVRKSFISRRGTRLVSLDYSGIELRCLALVSDDSQLLEDTVNGDVHLEVAQLIAGHELDKTTPSGKALRQAAKAVSFGIIYGISSWGLSGAMKTSEGQAQSMIDAWVSRYPDAFSYRHKQMHEAKKTGFVECFGGGTIYMTRNPMLTRCANYGVQRAALAVMARAIIRHKNTLDDERASKRQVKTLMIGTIHDALIDEANTRDAARCLDLMKTDMEQGYLDVFPGAPIDRLVEGGTGADWHRLD
jgi:DNA polymerase I-like protein with 3'-5' exonuclease and polymerase domains